MRHSGAAVPLPVCELQEEHSFLNRHRGQTNKQHRELHGPELEAACVLPRTACPLPQPAVILDFHILDLLLSVDM